DAISCSFFKIRLTAVSTPLPYTTLFRSYLAMAAVMLVGIITTLVIREPTVNRRYKDYKRSDYYRLVAVFFVAVISFVVSYILSRSEEHTSELQSRFDLVCRLLLEKKNKS